MANPRVPNEVIVVGSTEPVDVQLRADGAAQVGTGLDVTLEIARYENGIESAVALPPTIAWLDQATGTVRVTDVDRLVVGHYAVRYRLTNSAGKFGRCPNDESADYWKVVGVATL